MKKTTDKPRVPMRFKSEADEVEWYDKNPGWLEGVMLHAMKTGAVQRGMAAKLTQAAKESKNITIRMPVADLDRARKLAEKKGLGYQTYMKMLLHEALDRESRKAG